MKLENPLLRETIRMSVSPAHIPRLNIIQETDYEGVMRKTAEHFREIGKRVDDEYLTAGIFALQQYYAVALLDPANAHAVSVPVDPFWHSHILHTEDYFEFCTKVVGEYMHHRPLDHRNRPQLQNVRTLYGYTLEVLGKLFTHVDERFWGTDMSDAAMICFHKGNTETYVGLQEYRLFPPVGRGQATAFAD